MPAYGEVGIRSNVRGPINLTPDGYPLAGPAPGHDNVWLAEGFTGGPTMGCGIGYYLSQWILEGEPGIDFIRTDPRRYGRWATKRFACARNRERFGDNFGIHYPDYQMKTARGVKRFPVHDAYSAAGAVWSSDQGWELPAWFAPHGVEAVDRYSYRRANYFPHVGAECRAVREAVGLMNLSNLAKFEVGGPGAQGFLDRFLANRLPSEPGRVRLGHHLTHGGGIAAEYVVTRLGDERFYLSGTARLHAHHFELLVRAMPNDGSMRIDDVTMRRGVFVVAGPNARAVLQPLVDVDLSNPSFPWMRAKIGDVGYASDVVMVRANYVGELGWELHHPIEYSASLHESIVEAGRPHGLRLVGGRAIESLRLEKSYRSMISDIDSETSPLDAGMERFVAADKGEFIGRTGYLLRRQAGSSRRFSVLDVEPGDSDATGEEGIHHGGELVGSVASGGYSHTLGRLLVHAYLPVEIASPGTDLTVSVLMERRPARSGRRVAVRPAEPTAARVELNSGSGPATPVAAPVRQVNGRSNDYDRPRMQDRLISCVSHTSEQPCTREIPMHSFTRWILVAVGLTLALTASAAKDPNEKVIKSRQCCDVAAELVRRSSVPDGKGRHGIRRGDGRQLRRAPEHHRQPRRRRDVAPGNRQRRVRGQDSGPPRDLVDLPGRRREGPGAEGCRRGPRRGGGRRARRATLEHRRCRQGVQGLPRRLPRREDVDAAARTVGPIGATPGCEASAPGRGGSPHRGLRAPRGASP